jgi:hypothetical protein
LARTDVFGFLRGILVTLQSLVAMLLVGAVYLFLLAMGVPLPVEGLLGELLMLAVLFPAFFAVTYMGLARAAQSGLRNFLAVLAGVTACNLIGEGLAMAGVFDFMSEGATPPVIPPALTGVLPYLILGGVAYAAWFSAQPAEAQAT